MQGDVEAFQSKLLQWQWKQATRDRLTMDESTITSEHGGISSTFSNEGAREPSNSSQNEGRKSEKSSYMNSTLTVPLPRRAVYVPGGLPRGVRAYYYNAYNRAIKAPDFYLKNVDPLLHWPFCS